MDKAQKVQHLWMLMDGLQHSEGWEALLNLVDSKRQEYVDDLLTGVDQSEYHYIRGVVEGLAIAVELPMNVKAAPQAWLEMMGEDNG